MINKEELLAILGLVVAVSFLLFNQINIDDAPEPRKNSTNLELVSHELDFQGSMNNVKLSDNSIVLDTFTEVDKTRISNGKALAGSSSDAVFITKKNGSTARYSEGKERMIGIDSTFGSAIGDYDYPGFNIIYGDSDQNAYVRNLETGEEELIHRDILEVVDVDLDQNGLRESAQVRLQSGQTVNYRPQEDSESRGDLDLDGYEERFYIKNQKLANYDRKHGEEFLTNATDYAVSDNTVYVSDNGEINQLRFNQLYEDSGSYESGTEKFDRNVEFVQFISKAELNSQQISVTVKSGDGSETFELQDGYTNRNLSLSGNQLSTMFELSTDNPSKTPKLEQYQIRVKK